MPGPIEQVLDSLRRRAPVTLPVAVIVAHPDDETIGLGPLLRLFRKLLMVHVTDGAPRDGWDAQAGGFASCGDYARARRTELRNALDTVGAAPRLVALGWPDQQASFHLDRLTSELRRILAGVAVVMTHAYEGGHPDHDAVCVAAHRSGCPIVEMTGYHAAADGSLLAGRFLPGPDAMVVRLDGREQAERDAMLGCFTSQQATLAPFRGAVEQRYRPAPAYDFTAPPAARVYYDQFPWGMNSASWCALAAGVSG